MARVPLEVAIGCGVPPRVEESVVKFNVKTTASYAAVMVNPSQAEFRIPAERCGDTSYREVITAEAIVTTSRSAPALASFATIVEATIHEENTVHGPVAAEFLIVNDFLPLSLLNPQRLFAKTAPGTRIAFPFEVQNLGNGPVVIEMDVAQPNMNKLDAVTVGPSIHLESRAHKGAAAAFKQMGEIEVQAPDAGGYVNEIYQFNAKFTTRYDGEISGTSLTDEQTIAFALQVQGGLGGAAAAVSPLVLVGAAVAVALVLRRRP